MADNELGVETVQARPCRRKYCSLELLIGHSVSVFECELFSSCKNSLVMYSNEIILRLLLFFHWIFWSFILEQNPKELAYLNLNEV